MFKKNNTGFTMIELLVVIAIIAIIAAIAIPSYRSYSLKSRRADGINTILSISLAEESYRSNNAQYGTLAQVNISATSPQGYYSMSVSNVTSTSYTITATAQGAQTSDAEGGTSCATLQLVVSSGNLTKTPSNCWPS